MKKGQAMNYGLTFIIITVAVILVATFAIPQIKDPLAPADYTEVLNNVNTTQSTVSLTQTDIVSGSLTITGLTLTDNYTVDYTAETVTFVTGTIAGNYTTNYEYEDATYLTGSSNRALWAILGLAFIIGLVFIIFRMFGMA